MKFKLILLLYLSGLFTSVALAQVVIQTTDITCNGKVNGKATITINNAPGPYKIKWFKEGLELSEYKNKQVASGLKAGSYTIEIIDKNDCMIQKEFTIQEPEPLSIAITSSTGDFDYCGSKSFPDVTLYGTSSGGTPPRSCSVSSCLKKVTGPGEYSFTVTDAKGCQKTESVRVNWVGLFCSSDPNDINGPAGYDIPKWVAAREPMEYTIRFENDPDFATAPAQHVLIEYTFDPKINPFSLRLGNFGFGDFLFTLPYTSTFYQNRIDLQSELGIWLDVICGMDINTNKAFWSFQSIDPSTGLPPTDPQLGFLPVNDTLTGSGEGYVNFTVTPKTSAVTGDIVSANADIRFDANEVINTNTWSNKLDALAPTSTLSQLDTFTENPNIPLSWSGTDDPGGCGIRDYALYYQVNGGAFVLHSESITDTSIVFEGDAGNTYGFYVVATDHVGNVEIKSLAEQSIMVAAIDRIDILSPLSEAVCIRDTMTISWDNTNVDSLSISMSIDSGQTFFILAPLKLKPDSIMSVYVDDSLLTNYAQILFTSLESTPYESRSAFFPIKPLPEIAIAGEETLCGDAVAYLFANGGNQYSWIPGPFFNDSLSATPTAYIDSLATLWLEGTDVFGCSNTDSIFIQRFPEYLDSLTFMICNEDSVYAGGAYQHNPGFYTDSLSSEHGCDSTIVTEVILTGPCPFPSPQVYVDKDATGLNNGTSWINAFTDLQDALEAVDYYVDVTDIWIAEGDYYPSVPSGRNASYVLRDSVKLYGGFMGIENTLEERSGNATLVRLSGDVGTLLDSMDNVFHVIRIDTSCVDCLINNLTIQFGQGDGNNQETFGAGLYVQGVARLESVTVERNTTVNEGAAIYNSGNTAILTIMDCIFRLNTSSLARDILNTGGAEIQFEGLNTIQE